MSLQALLLRIAHAAIEEEFGKPFSLSKEILTEQFPELSQERATYVTVRGKDDTVRGCIGSMVPQKMLYDDLINNAKAAAFGDRRYTPLSREEYPDCHIEISLLTLPRAVAYADAEDLRTKIRPGVDGVIMQMGERTGNFLPQVWEEFPDFDYFFAQLGQKAGIGDKPLTQHPKIYTYRVERLVDPVTKRKEFRKDGTLFLTAADAEAAFYSAFERRDLDAMLAVWAEEEQITCIHPGGELLRGHARVAQNWKEMLQASAGISFALEAIEAVEDRSLSVRTVRERIFVNGMLAATALATNVYRQREGNWEMLSHHASPEPAGLGGGG